MYASFRLVRFAAVTISALALTGCATFDVSSFRERGADFTRYRTYDWGPPDSWSTGDPRLDDNPFFQNRVRTDVDEQLATKGFEKTTSGRPDLRVHYHASITQRIDSQGIDKESGYCVTHDCRPYVYEAGTLLIDLVDTGSNRVVWRGWAEGSVDGVIDNQEWLERRIGDAVTRIFKQLPRRL